MSSLVVVMVGVWGHFNEHPVSLLNGGKATYAQGWEHRQAQPFPGANHSMDCNRVSMNAMAEQCHFPRPRGCHSQCVRGQAQGQC